jgi:hypothetical protein
MSLKNYAIVFINRYVQKKVQRRCNKRVRFHDSTFQHESSLPGLVPEDSSLIVSHASEDSSDVQVKWLARKFKNSVHLI